MNKPPIRASEDYLLFCGKCKINFFDFNRDERLAQIFLFIMDSPIMDPAIQSNISSDTIGDPMEAIRLKFLYSKHK